MKAVTRRFKYGKHEVTLETGRIARQSSGAVLVCMGDTTVLVTVVASREPSNRDFFPLTVDYEERTYSAGRIPGGFFKREGRPSEKAILTCRLTDRPIRPLFPDGFKNEVQVIATVMSIDPEIDPDIPAMLGASAALTLSGVPFKGPIGAARVGFAVLMVESEAQELSEEQMLGAVMFGHEQMKEAISEIRSLADEAGQPAWEWERPETDESLAAKVDSTGRSHLEKCLSDGGQSRATGSGRGSQTAGGVGIVP